MIKAHGDRATLGGIAAMGMFAAEADAWDAAEQAWKDAAKAIDCFPFRMTNFVAATRGREGERLTLLGPLLKVLCAHVRVGTAAVMNVADWEPLPMVVAVRLGSPYLALASAAFAMVSRWRADKGRTDGIACVFEQGKEEGQDIFRDASSRILKYADFLQRDYGVEDIVFAPKGRAGLAMADMLAWLMTHYVPEMRVDDPLAHGVLDVMLSSDVDLRRFYFTRDKLVDIAKNNTNERLLALQRQYGFGLKIKP